MATGAGGGALALAWKVGWSRRWSRGEDKLPLPFWKLPFNYAPTGMQMRVG